LLPFIEQNGLYQAWNKDEAWNSPANQSLARQDIPVFRDASSVSPPGQTDYLFIVGPGTAFEELDGEAMSFAQIADGLSNTIFVIEVKGSGANWAEPKDVDINQVASQPGNHSGGNIVGFGDGSVRFMPKSTSPQTMHDLSTRNGGEIVNPGF
jgi:prepilin-type processing-associated H-X9-DG protein